MSLPFRPLPVSVMPLWPPVGSTSSMEFPASNRSPEMHRFNVPVSSTVRICQHCFCLVLICWLLSCNAQPICFMYDPVDYGTMFLLYCIGNKTHTHPFSGPLSGTTRVRFEPERTGTPFLFFFWSPERRSGPFRHIAAKFRFQSDKFGLFGSKMLSASGDFAPLAGGTAPRPPYRLALPRSPYS